MRTLGVEATFMGIGVDRVDYTKGILERFLAIERFLEKYPQLSGEIHVRADRRAQPHPHQALSRSCWRKWKRRRSASIGASRAASGSPSCSSSASTAIKEIEPYYRAADLCLVTSLHDGMNLVAKEFLAARRDERGVLILSQFTGAARELRDALLVNPYDIDQTADAIRAALEMEPEDKQLRMQPHAQGHQGAQHLPLGREPDHGTL